MASVIGICNRGLQKLGAERIISLTQDSVSARACNLVYEPARDAELRAHAWNFAIRRAELAASGTAPEYGYDYQYPFPSGCLRILPNDHNEGAYPNDWKIEGRAILSNDGGPLQVRYIAKITDTTQFDASFTEVLACRIACELCEELTQSNSKRELAERDYRMALREARKMNAYENPPAQAQEDTWLSIRR